ncbi:hypothetical protein KAR91_53655 [Candidatus Pacearchaeota archaeon]|nr:hypothetical protein [Candidatus Pacearchaeota archaeon]
MPTSKKDFSEANLVALKALDAIEEKIDYLLSPKQISDIENIALPIITPKIRKFLLQNYDNVGLGVVSGKLRKAVSGVVVELSLLEGFLSYALPPGIPDYEGAHKGKFYTASASINYGSVSGLKGGEKVRKRVKKAVQKAVQKGKTEQDIIAGGTSGHILTGGKETKSGSAKFAGGIVVTKAYDFFELTSVQLAEIQNDIIEARNLTL